MKTIWKYPFGNECVHEVSIPLIKPLCVQRQNNQFCLWALVDTEAKPVPCKVVICGTGTNTPDDISEHEYVGTVQVGAFVFHTFVKRINEDKA